MHDEVLEDRKWLNLGIHEMTDFFFFFLSIVDSIVRQKAKRKFTVAFPRVRKMSKTLLSSCFIIQKVCI